MTKGNVGVATRVTSKQILFAAVGIIVVIMFVIISNVGGKTRLDTKNVLAVNKKIAAERTDMVADVDTFGGRLALTLVKTITEPSFLIFALDDDRDYVSRTIRAQLKWTDENLTFLLKRTMEHKCRNGEVMFDVGGNLGYFSMYASAMGCKVHTFEMQPMLVNLIRLSHSTNPTTHGKINVVHTAVGATTGQEVPVLLLHGSGDLGSAGVGANSQMDFKNNVTVGSITTVAIDDYIEQSGIEMVSFMKMDVEGYEWEATQGLLRSLRKHKVDNLFMEVRKFNFNRMIELMHSLGYTATDTGAGGGPVNTQSEIDALHVRYNCNPASNCYTDILFNTPEKPKPIKS